MGKLSHIEDIEQREAEPQSQEAAQKAAPHEAQEQARDSQPMHGSEQQAEEDVEFHGLDSAQPMGALHKVLFAAAVVVVIIAILYVVNSWIPFI